MAKKTQKKVELVPFKVRLKPELHAKLERISKNKGVSMVDVIRLWIVAEEI